MKNLGFRLRVQMCCLDPSIHPSIHPCIHASMRKDSQPARQTNYIYIYIYIYDTHTHVNIKYFAQHVLIVMDACICLVCIYFLVKLGFNISSSYIKPYTFRNSWRQRGQCPCADNLQTAVLCDEELNMLRGETSEASLTLLNSFNRVAGRYLFSFAE